MWTDVNNDGFVDLFVGNENRAAQLFLNKRDGTFEDVAPRAGVDRPGYTKGVPAADVDNDGWPELYVSNFGGANALFYNNHDGTFTDVTGRPASPGREGVCDLVLRLRQRRLVGRLCRQLLHVGRRSRRGRT